MNKTIVKFQAVILATALLVPTLSLAEDNDRPPIKNSASGEQRKQEGSATKSNDQFCTRITQSEKTVGTGITEKKEKLKTAQTDRANKLANTFTDRTNKLTEARAKADAQRKANFEKLASKATTDAQKAAVAKFKATIENAITVRRAAVDKALSDYKAGFDALVLARKNGATAAASDVKTQMDAAIAKAKADCAAGVNSTTVKQTYMQSLIEIKKGLQTDRQNLEKLKPQLQTLKNTRDEAIKKALNDFKATAEQARKELKTAFGITTPTPTPSTSTPQ